MTARKPAKPFTTHEIDLIKQHYDGTKASAEMLAQQTGRSFTAIRVRAHKLGVAPGKRRWTTDDLAVLKHFYDGTSQVTKWLMSELNRSQHAIFSMAKKLGVAGKNQWTEEEDDLLEEHYTKPGGVEFLTSRLDKRSRNAIICRAYVLGVNTNQKTTSI